jgi:hypothetical protein
MEKGSPDLEPQMQVGSAVGVFNVNEARTVASALSASLRSIHVGCKQKQLSYSGPLYEHRKLISVHFAAQRKRTA